MTLQVIEQRQRHIPIKRIAPYPTTETMIAQPKRSKMVCAPVLKSKALSVRPANACMPCKKELPQPHPGINQHSIRSASGMHGWTPVVHNTHRPGSVSLGQKEFVCNVHQPTSAVFTSNTSNILGCCPLRSTSTGYNTPPYYIKQPNEAGVKRARPKKKLKGLKLIGNHSTMTSNSVNFGCLQSMKITAKNTINVATNCVNDNVSTGMGNNACTTDGARIVTNFEGQTASTALGSNSNGSVKTTESSQRYSSNFNPQSTSTPQRSRHTTTSTEASGEFKKPYPPKDIFEEGDLTIMLSNMEKENAAKGLTPLDELAALLEISICNFQGDRRENIDVTNNNMFQHSDFGNGANKQRLTCKLPSMRHIGAPKAASSPVLAQKMNQRTGAVTDQSTRYRHFAGSDSNDTFANTASGVTGFWRPWVEIKS